MTEEKEYEYRVGGTIRWGIKTHYGFSQGVTIDNLDKKKIDQAHGEFEQIFVSIRDELVNNSARCLDDDGDLLTVCQNLSKMLKNKYNFQLKGGAG